MTDKKEQFKILREINSLQLNIGHLRAEYESEEKRLDSIKTQRDSRAQELQYHQDRLKQLQFQVTEIELQLSQKYQRLERIETNLKQVSSEQELHALEQEQQLLKTRIQQLEEQGLEYLETIEQIESEIRDGENFIAGISETFREIQDEVSSSNELKQTEIEKIIKRISLLKSELPEEFTRKIESLFAKKIPKSYFTRIEGKNCEQCRVEFNFILIENVEVKLALINCPICSRIILPESSYY